MRNNTSTARSMAPTVVDTELTPSSTPSTVARMADAARSKQPKRRRPKKAATNTGAQIALRADAALIEALDAEAERLRKERPGATIHRSDVVRELCWRALRGVGR